MSKPISPRQHGLIDYGFLTSMLLLPSLLGMSSRARLLFAFFGTIQGTLNALTDQPFGLARVVSFRTHGSVEKSSGPLYLLAPLVTGVAQEGEARAYWLFMGAALVTVYNLTDWQARNTST